MKNASQIFVALFFVLTGVLFAQTTQEGIAIPEDTGGGIGLSPAVMRTLVSPLQSKNNPHRTRCKGAFLRTKIISTKKSFGIDPTITICEPNHQPALKLEKQEFRIFTEMRLYEALMRTFTPGDDESHGTYDYERIEGEVWEGETSQRTVLHGSKPLANTKVTVNGIPLQTDAQGVILDPENRLAILETFDNLSTRKANFLIESEDMDPVELPMMRTMPRRRMDDERGIDEDDRHELLLAFNLDFTISKVEPEQASLQCKAILPKDFAYAQAGVPFPLKIQVFNPSKRQTSCLLARSFSRCPGLDGKLFYFGAIPPGKTMEFTRMVTVDKTEKANSANLELRFSDSWGILTQKIPLSFTVIH